jgi:tetratricopeptide (TPR) repeat protein
MGRIFLSYARDDRDFAKRLARVLEDHGHQLWWDRRLDGGEEFGAEIEAALAESDVVLVAWSTSSVKSRWVRDEAAVGGDSGRLVPLSIDGSQPPMGFRQFHTVELADWKGGKRDRRTADLLQSIERKLGGKRPEQQAPPPAAAAPRRKWQWLLGGLLFLLIGGGGAYFLLGRSERASARPRLTVALLPFTATSSDGLLRDMAAQATDSLGHTLPTSGIDVRMLGAPPKDARGSGDFVISGEVSGSGDKLLATVRMDHVRHRLTVFTRRFEVPRAQASELPERIGAQMAGTIAWAAPLIELEINHPSDPSVTADLMRQLDFLGDPLQGFQASQRAAARDRNSVFAQVSLAFNTAMTLSLLPADERAKNVADARQAAARAVQLAPEFGDSYGVGCYLQSETLLADCEGRLRRSRQVDPGSPFADAFLSQLLRIVGRFDEARTLAQLSYARDPYVPTKIGWMLRTLEFNGEHAAAEALYDKGVRWWPEFATSYFENRLLTLLEQGEWRAVGELEQKAAPDGLPQAYTDSGAIVAAVASHSAAGVTKACGDAQEHWLRLRCFVAYANVGDLDRAFALSETLYPSRIGRNAADTERIWLESPDPVAPLEILSSPAAAPLRRDPRYLALVKRTGLLDYWRRQPLASFCAKQPEPVCAQLRARS